MKERLTKFIISLIAAPFLLTGIAITALAASLAVALTVVLACLLIAIMPIVALVNPDSVHFERGY